MEIIHETFVQQILNELSSSYSVHLSATIATNYACLISVSVIRKSHVAEKSGLARRLSVACRIIAAAIDDNEGAVWESDEPTHGTVVQHVIILLIRRCGRLARAGIR